MPAPLHGPSRRRRRLDPAPSPSRPYHRRRPAQTKPHSQGLPLPPAASRHQPPPSADLTALAVRVIQSANREHPVDTVLRTQLRANAALTPAQRTEISRRVFAYYRWLQWLSPQTSLPQQLQSARQLQEQFQTQPQSFPPQELRQRAVPTWTPHHLPVTLEWVRHLQGEAPLWLRCRPGQPSILAAALGDCVPLSRGLLATALRYTGPADLFRRTEFHQGDFEIQDITSQAVGWICHPQPGQTWWDVCAGEGGKTLHLADLMANHGLIWATDRCPWRLQRLRRRAARARVFNYRTTPWDGSPKLPFKTLFDGVLVDAPCSGIGTWQRNPQARWTVGESDIDELADLQLDLLCRAATRLKPGGRLIYAVCTLAAIETTAVGAEFLRRCPAFSPCPEPNPFHPEREPASSFQFWPQDEHGNGMFVAVWRRQS